jgi:hypothetical protein
MTVATILPASAVGIGGAVVVDLVAPTAQNTTNSYAAVTGSTIDIRAFRSVSYSIRNSAGVNSLDWKVQAANVSDFSDVVDVKAEAAVAAAGIDSYAVAQAPYSYYRVVVKSTVADTPGTAVVHGIAKQ